MSSIDESWWRDSGINRLECPECGEWGYDEISAEYVVDVSTRASTSGTIFQGYLCHCRACGEEWRQEL